MRIECPLLSRNDTIAHGFFTRKGGVSAGIYSTLNLGEGSHDVPENIQQNRAYIKASLGAEKLVTLYQIHSSKVVVADNNTMRVEGDGLVTSVGQVAIGVLTADCVPVLFADYKNGVIGAAHAGWKGACAGVTENVIAAMLKQGADRACIIASVGPCIGQKNYEVGAEFRDNFLQDSVDNERFFSASNRVNYYRFALAEYVVARLKLQELSAVSCLEHDTYSQEELFFSFRRATHKAEADYGRQISAIMLQG